MRRFIIGLLIAFMSGIVLFSGMTSAAPEQKQQAAAKWEYKVFAVNAGKLDELEKQLGDLGREGCELTGTTSKQSGAGSSFFYFILKRVK